MLIGVAGADRTAVRLSPNDEPQGCSDSDSESLFTKAADALNGLEIAFLEMRASRPNSTFRPATRRLVPAIRWPFKGKLILNSDYALEDASQARPRRVKRHSIRPVEWSALCEPDRQVGICEKGPAKGNCIGVAPAQVHRLSRVDVGCMATA